MLSTLVWLGVGAIVLVLLIGAMRVLSIWFGSIPFHFSLVMQGLFTVLLLMLGRVVTVMTGRMIKFKRSCRESVRFARQATGALEHDDIREALLAADRNKKGHIARVVASGLENLQAPSRLSTRELIELAKRASDRSAATVHAEMKQGLNSLATIASTAPLIGFLGSVFGIINSFVGCGGEKSACMAAVARNLSQALWTTALGIVVAIPAMWCYRYLNDRIELIDAEMGNASLELVDYLSAYLARRGRYLID